MTNASLVLASDHGGFALKEILKQKLTQAQVRFEDLGVHSEESVDYPDFAAQVAKSVVAGKFKLGLLICGTGQGMAIAANKIAGIRAAVVMDTFSARMAREHNDANVICLGGRVIGSELAWELLKTFLAAEFAGGRHQKRVEKINNLDLRK